MKIRSNFRLLQVDKVPLSQLPASNILIGPRTAPYACTDSANARSRGARGPTPPSEASIHLNSPLLRKEISCLTVQGLERIAHCGDHPKVSFGKDEVAYWTKELGVSSERLKDPVAKHGVMAVDAKKAIGKL